MVSVFWPGPDLPFTNNYGVWRDEFAALGLEHTLEATWDDAMCYFGEGQEVRVGRGYGRFVSLVLSPRPLIMSLAPVSAYCLKASSLLCGYVP